MKTGRALAEELGISYRQVHHWTEQGHVVPVEGTFDGGDPVLNFRGDEERILRIMAGLVKFGIKVSVAAGLARDHVTSKDRISMFDIDGIGFIHIQG